MLPVFKSMENYFGGADEWHGKGGEVMVNEARVEWEVRIFSHNFHHTHIDLHARTLAALTKIFAYFHQSFT